MFTSNNTRGERKSIIASSYPFSLISKYRSELMGIACIFISPCHFSNALKEHDKTVSLFAKILEHLHSDVDVFMFLSGFGLFYSYQKRRTTYGTFIKKRCGKVLPTYLFVSSVTYIVYDVLLSNNGIINPLKRVLFIPWFMEGSTKGWFVLTIVIFYLLFPMVYKAIERLNRWELLCYIMFLIMFWLITAFFDLKYENYRLFRFRQAIERFPIFVFGVLCGKWSLEKKEITKVGFCIHDLPRNFQHYSPVFV